MADDQRKKTGPLKNPSNNAAQIYAHQRGTEAIAKYAPKVVPLLHEVIETHFGDTPGYGIDDNIELDSDDLRFGWRIFGMGAGEASFAGETMYFTEAAAGAPQRKTLLTVQIVLGDLGYPTGFLVDTLRTYTTVKTGLLGLKQKVQMTTGRSRGAKLNEADLAEALAEIAQTMEK